MITNSLMKVSGMHIINAMNDESRNQAIQDIETWCGSAATSRTIIDHYRSRLEGLRLTKETTASSYVNEFLICSSKLDKKREGYTAETKRHKFLDQIKDDDYDVVKQKLQGDTSIDFDTCVKRIRSREKDLSTDKKTKEKGRAQRFVRKGGNVNSKRTTAPKESTTYQKERSHQSRDISCIRSSLKMPEKILSDGGEFTTTKKGRSGLMNSRGTPETNMGTTAMPRRRHHRSHQGQEEKLRKTTTDK